MNKAIIDTIYDGIIILEKNGAIRELNDSATALLGIDKTYIGKPYAEIMLENDIEENDEFHQTLLDAITEKSIQKDRIPYIKKDGSKSFINLSVSKLQSDAGESQFYIVFKDITTEIKERKLRDDYVTALLIIIGFIASLNFLSALWTYLGKPVSQTTHGALIVLSVLVGCFFLAECTDLKKSDLGLSIQGKSRDILIDALATALCVAILMGAKLVLMKTNPNYEFYTDGSFIQWSKYSLLEWLFYPIMVIGQEIACRSFIHESLSRIIPNDENEIKTILLSSLLFGSIHVYLGFRYMIGATALLFVFGFVYRKQRSVWGLCIPHFVLGQMIGLLGFVAY